MRKFKRSFLVIFLSLICAFCLAFGLSACNLFSSNSNDDDDDDDDNETTDLIDSSTSGTGAIDGITITLKDISFSMPYSSGSSVYYQTFTFDAGELYINIGDLSGVSSVTMYADGELTFTDTHYSSNNFSYAATLYGDGETAYITLDATQSGDDMDIIATVSYADLLNFHGLDNMLLSSSDSAEIKNEIIPVLLQISPLLEGEVEIDDSVIQVIEALNSYMNNSYATTNALSQNLFTVTTTSNGTVSTLDTSVLIEFYQDAYELSCSEFVDKYDGEGTYQSTCDYFASLGDMTLQELVLSTASDAGLGSVTLYQAIDYIVEQLTGEEFDIESILNADGTVEEQYAMIQAIANMTVDEFLYEYSGTTTAEMVELLESYKDYTLFEIMFTSTSEAEEVYSIINDIFTLIDNSVDLTCTEYNDGNVEISLGVNKLTFSQDGVNFTANGEITIATGATIPSYAGDIKTAGSDIYSSLATAVNAIATDGVYTIDDDCYLSVSGSKVKYVNDAEYTLSANSGLQMLFVGYADEGGYCLMILDTASDSNKMITLVINTDSTDEYFVEMQDVYTLTYNTNGDLASVVEKYISNYSYYNNNDYTTTYKYTYNSSGWITKEVYTRTYSDGTSYTSTTTYTYSTVSQDTLFGYNVYYVKVTVTYSDGGSGSYYTYMLDSDILQLLN